MKKTVGRIVIIVAIGLIAGYFLMRAARPVPEYSMPSASMVAAEQTPSQSDEQKQEPKRNEPKGPIQLKFRASEFSNNQKSVFAENFQKKYQPAILKWSKAYHGHLPIAPEDITADKLAERVGNGDAYSEYIFVVNGVTLGVRDSKAEVAVDYLNVKKQTQKLNTLPDGSEVPKLTSPVGQQEILQMIRNDLGKEFNAKDVRTTPTGIAGALNGGAMVEVGGDPDNFASWRLNLVFDANGSLAYYLKGPPRID
jgi:hypothetical protein